MDRPDQDWRDTTPRPAEPPLELEVRDLPRLRAFDIFLAAAATWLALIMVVRLLIVTFSGD